MSNKMYARHQVGQFIMSKTGISFMELPDSSTVDDWIDEDGNVAIMEINHIDHNHKNNKLDNLEYICSNCHRARTLAPAEMKRQGIKGRSRTKFQELIYNYN